MSEVPQNKYALIKKNANQFQGFELEGSAEWLFTYNLMNENTLK